MTPPEEGLHDEAGYVGTQAVIPSPCLWEAEMGLEAQRPTSLEYDPAKERNERP